MTSDKTFRGFVLAHKGLRRKAPKGAFRDRAKWDYRLQQINSPEDLEAYLEIANLHYTTDIAARWFWEMWVEKGKSR